MSVYDGMAYDGGYRGDEAKQVARMLEEEHRDQVLSPCEYSGHDWQDAGGGLEICMICEAERWADDTPSRGPSG